MIQVLDKQFKDFITADQIQTRISELAAVINSDYKGQKVSFVIVLNGAFMFASDLIKKITVDCELFFVKLKSYEGMKSAGSAKEIIGLTTSMAGKNVLLIEDIVDTGITMDQLYAQMETQDCQTVKAISLLFKPTAFKGKNKPDYIGFSIENKFVVGYGLDYDEYGRNLDAIYQLNE